MIWTITRSLAAAAALLLSGCAGVTFYSDASLQKQTGIPIYGSKPYLLVSRTGADAKPVEVSVQYLPDMDNVIYAYPRSGFGSSDLKLTFVDGRLTSFGQITDPKLGELITSFGGLITAGAGAVKTLAQKGLTTTQGADFNRADALSEEVQTMADNMARGLGLGGALNALKGRERTTAARVSAALASVAKVLSMTSNQGNQTLYDAQLAVLAQQAQDLGTIPPPDMTSTALNRAYQEIQRYRMDLLRMIKENAPAPATAPPPATFELYEIQKSPSGPVLRRVLP